MFISFYLFIVEKLTHRSAERNSYSAEAHSACAVTVSLSVSLDATRTQAAERHVGETGRDSVDAK